MVPRETSWMLQPASPRTTETRYSSPTTPTERVMPLRGVRGVLAPIAVGVWMQSGAGWGSASSDDCGRDATQPRSMAQGLECGDTYLGDQVHLSAGSGVRLTKHPQARYHQGQAREGH